MHVPIVDSCHHLIVTPPVPAQLFTLCLQCTHLYAILSDECNATSGSSAAEEMGRTSRSHSSRLRIAALTADNLAALEPRRRSDPRGEIGAAAAGLAMCTSACSVRGEHGHISSSRRHADAELAGCMLFAYMVSL
jgi:hypothetical protein